MLLMLQQLHSTLLMLLLPPYRHGMRLPLLLLPLLRLRMQRICRR